MAKRRKILNNKYLLGLSTGFLVAIFVSVLIPQIFVKGQQFLKERELQKIEQLKPKPLSEEEKAKLTAQVLPEQGVNLEVTLGPAVIKMVEAGVIDKDKFLGLYIERGLPA